MLGIGTTRRSAYRTSIAIGQMSEPVFCPLCCCHGFGSLHRDGFNGFFILAYIFMANDGVPEERMVFVDGNVVTQIDILTTILSRPSPNREA